MVARTRTHTHQYKPRRQKREEGFPPRRLISLTEKGQPGILELEARKKLEEAIEAERNAQKELDEAVYDILGLKCQHALI